MEFSLKSKVVELVESHLREEMAEADSVRTIEIERLLTVLRFLPKRSYGPGDGVVPSALVELELGTVRALYFLVPQGGGLVTSVEGRPVQVITPQSPLGERMLGKKVGDSFTVETASGGQRNYRVVGIV